MRVSWVVALLALSACDVSFWEEGSWSEGAMYGDGTLYSATRGVQLSDDGSYAVAGMNGTTCWVDGEQGFIGSDYDFEGEDEKLVDVHDDEQGDDEFLVVAPERVHAFVPDAFFGDGGVSYDVPGVLDAAFDSDGVVALAEDDGCHVELIRTDSQTRLDLGEALCVDVSSFDVLDAHVVIASQSGVTAVDLATGAATVLDADADQSVVVGDSVLVSTADELTGLDVSGVEQFTASVEGDVVGLEQQGAAFAVLHVDSAGDAYVTTLDAVGTEVQVEFLGAGVDAVSFSGDGSRMAIIHRDTVRFQAL